MLANSYSMYLLERGKYPASTLSPEGSVHSFCPNQRQKSIRQFAYEEQRYIG